MQFGPYLVGEALGQGGMATVYRATDTRNNQQLALKLLHPEVTTQPRLRRRFETEIQTLTRLQHANAVRVYDAGLHEGRLWLALELIAGESLQDRISREQQLPVEDALRITRCLAEALAHAHAHGVLHRDVKPDNVLLAPQQRVVLTDFGLALDQEQAAGLSRLTRDGSLMGTPGYWAPEQAHGKLAQLGPATDVYGLGATLYACLTGSPPIQGEHLVAFLRTGVFEGIAPLAQARPDVPPWLSDVCQRCLNPDPSARFPNAQSLLDVLQARGMRSTRWGLPGVGGLLAAVFTALALLLAGWALSHTSPMDSATGGSGVRVPPVARLHAELTEALLRTRLNAAAEATASVAIQAAPWWPEPWAQRAFARAREGNTEGTHADVARALQLDSDCAAALLARAEVAIVARDGEAAVADRDRLLKLAPELTWTHAVNGGVLRLQERLVEAENAYRKALELDPTHPLARSELAFLLAQSGRIEQALAEYERCLKLTPHVAEDWRNRGYMLLKLKRFDEAREGLDQALRLHPDHPVGLVHRGTLAYQQGRFGDSLADFERVIELDADNFTARTYAGLLANRAKRFGVALAHFEYALTIRPDSSSSHMNCALTLKQMGRLKDALLAYDRALELSPYDPGAYASRATVHLQLGNVQLAVADTDRALGIDSELGVARVTRALARAKLTDWEGAIADMESYLAKPAAAAAADTPNFKRMLREWKQRLR